MALIIDVVTGQVKVKMSPAQTLPEELLKCPTAQSAIRSTLAPLF